MFYEFSDRISTKPKRKKITYDNGNEEFVNIDLADEPINQGTPVNERLLKSLVSDITPATAINNGNTIELTLNNLGEFNPPELFFVHYIAKQGCPYMPTVNITNIKGYNELNLYYDDYNERRVTTAAYGAGKSVILAIYNKKAFLFGQSQEFDSWYPHFTVFSAAETPYFIDYKYISAYYVRTMKDIYMNFYLEVLIKEKYSGNVNIMGFPYDLKNNYHNVVIEKFHIDGIRCPTANPAIFTAEVFNSGIRIFQTSLSNGNMSSLDMSDIQIENITRTRPLIIKGFVRGVL